MSTAATLIPAGAPVVDLLTFPAGGIACVVTDDPVTWRQLAQLQAFVPRGRFDRSAATRWGARLVWADPHFKLPEPRPAPPFTTRLHLVS